MHRMYDMRTQSLGIFELFIIKYFWTFVQKFDSIIDKRCLNMMYM